MSELNQYGILYVDDEPVALKYFDRGFSKSFKIFTAPSAVAGWEAMEQHHREIGVLMTDQRMPGQTGVELLEKVRRKYPQVVRILVTAHSDLQSAIDAVNEGAIYKYIGKPWDVTELRITLLRALEFFAVLKERDSLLREKLSVLQGIVLSDRAKNLGVLAAGLASTYRGALAAAQRFMAAVPRLPLDVPIDATGHSVVGRHIERGIATASDSVFRMASTLRDLAERAPKAPPVPVSLGKLFAAAGQSAGLPAEKFTVEVAEDTPPVCCHEWQLGWMFQTLTDSLWQIGGPESQLGVTAHKASGGEGPGKVAVRFHGGGPAWDAERWHRFFAPFSAVREDDRRLGLALAVCFFIAEHHGARIKVLGEEETKLTVEVPVALTEVPAAPLLSHQLLELFSYERSWEQFLTHIT